MTEEAITETTETTETVATETPVYFGSDGTLADGWQGTLPEGYREEASLSTVKDAKVLAKMSVDTKRMVGKDTVAIPTDASTEGEWEEWHKAGGRPDTVADYNLAAPGGTPVEIAEKILPKEALAKAKADTKEYGMLNYVYKCVPVFRVDRGKIRVTKL